jgi:hypothetical protein
LLPLQRKRDGLPAAGPTALEFTDLMADIATTLDEQAQREDVQALLQTSGGWHYSFDSDSIHTSANLQDVGILKKDICTCPALSPDFQRVVERTHARLWRSFERSMADLPDDSPISAYEDLLREKFQEAAAADVIAGDVVKLPVLYKIVSSPTTEEAVEGVFGAAGDWPPGKYR